MVLALMSKTNKIPPPGGWQDTPNLLAVCTRWENDGGSSCAFGHFSLEDRSIYKETLYVPQVEVLGDIPLRRGDRVVLDLVWEAGAACGKQVRRRERKPFVPLGRAALALDIWVPACRRALSVKPHVFAAGTTVAQALRPSLVHLSLPLPGSAQDPNIFGQHYELWATPAPPLLARPVPHLRDIHSLAPFLGLKFYLLSKAHFFDMDRCKEVITLGNYPMAQFFMDTDPRSYCWQLREGDSLADLLARYQQWPDGRPLRGLVSDTERDTRFYVYTGADHFSLLPDAVPDQLPSALFSLKAPLFAGKDVPDDLTIRVIRRGGGS